MADTTERLPFPISKKFASTVTDVIARNGREIHYTIAGVPFRVYTSPDLPLSMETAPQQKQQQDQEPEAGEQTLSGWWLRSQASWHEGAGARFTEAPVSAQNQSAPTYGFWESSNIDVWHQGDMKLLPEVVNAGSTVNRSVAIVPDSTVHSVVAGRVGAVVRYTDLDAGTATTNLYVNGGVTFTQVIATETDWYAAGNDGKVYSGPIGSTTTSPLVWTLNLAGSGKTRIGWAKHRLWAVNGNKIYDLDYGTPGVTSSVYNHPSAGWTYTDLTDGPGGVLFSGFGDGTSHVQRITLDATGAVPTLSGATTLAILPSDERALCINSLTGSLICIVTNLGVRVAASEASGDLTYGPLFLVRDTEVPLTAQPALTSAGRFWWLSFGDQNKLWRIDSSIELDAGVFAYASDMETTSAPISVAARNERPVVATVAGSLQHTHASNLCSIGFLQSGRIRFRTDEKKTYHYVELTAEPLDGLVTVDVLNEADSSLSLVTYDTQGIALPATQVPASFSTQRFMSVKLTLQRKVGDDTLGPVIQGVRVKALPASRPQRIYTLPLQCFDHEQWSTGQMEGYDGWAWDRYLSVRASEDVGGITLLVNYGFPNPLGELCRIEEMKFVQLLPPDSEQKDGGFGGVLQVTLRTLT